MPPYPDNIPDEHLPTEELANLSQTRVTPCTLRHAALSTGESPGSPTEQQLSVENYPRESSALLPRPATPSFPCLKFSLNHSTEALFMAWRALMTGRGDVSLINQRRKSRSESCARGLMRGSYSTQALPALPPSIANGTNRRTRQGRGGDGLRQVGKEAEGRAWAKA